LTQAEKNITGNATSVLISRFKHSVNKNFQEEFVGEDVWGMYHGFHKKAEGAMSFMIQCFNYESPAPEHSERLSTQ